MKKILHYLNILALSERKKSLKLRIRHKKDFRINRKEKSVKD